MGRGGLGSESFLCGNGIFTIGTFVGLGNSLWLAPSELSEILCQICCDTYLHPRLWASVWVVRYLSGLDGMFCV